MAKMRATQGASSQNEPALETGGAVTGVKIEHIEFDQSMYGGGNMVSIGANDSTQKLRSQQPDNVQVRACFFNAASTNPVWGHRRGIEMHGKNMVLVDCYFKNIGNPTGSADSSVFWALNGQGPYTIRNNYMEGGVYNVMTGGDQGFISSVATQQASPVPTETSVRVVITNGGEPPLIGQTVALTTRNGTWRFHPTVTNVTEINATTYDLAFNALGGDIPDGSGDARWGTVPKDVTFEYNHMLKPVEWRDSTILRMPQGVTAVGESGGSLPAGTYGVRVSSRATGHGEASLASERSGTINVTVPANGRINIQWTGSNSLTEFYRAYITYPDASVRHVSTPNEATHQIIYSTAGTALVGGISSASRWAVKNIFELKCGINVTVRGNIFENTWPGIGNGYAFWLKSSNQYIGPNTGAPSPWMETTNVLVELNIIRHCAGFISISGNELTTGGVLWRPKTLNGLMIQNNLMYDSKSPWTQGATPYGLNFANGGHNITYQHNTIIHGVQGLATLNANPGRDAWFTNLVFRDNLTAYKNTYGWRGQNDAVYTGEGEPAISAHTRGAYSWDHNVLAGATSSLYPQASNLFPAVATFDTTYVENIATWDLHLKAGSPAVGAGTGGSNIGADVDAVLAATANVIAGTVTAPSLPEITTTVLPNGTVGVFYSGDVNYTGGSLPVALTHTAGTLPTGLSWDVASRRLSGTPTVAGTYNFTITATDNVAATDPQAYTVVIAPAPVTPVLITPGALPPASVGTPYEHTILATGGTAPYTWTVEPDLPEGLELQADTGTISGTPVEAVNSPFTFTVTDLNGQTAFTTLTFTALSDTGYTIQVSKLNNIAANWRRLKLGFTALTMEEFIQRIFDDAMAPIRIMYDKERAAEVSRAYVAADLEQRNEAEEDLGVPKSGTEE
jgi:hypothetical protein